MTLDEIALAISRTYSADDYKSEKPFEVDGESYGQAFIEMRDRMKNIHGVGYVRCADIDRPNFYVRHVPVVAKEVF